MMRFISLMLLLAIGLGAAWGVCRFTTPRYESRCECEVAFENMAEGGFEENINTRLAAWRTEPGGAWPDVEIARVPRSRLIAMTAYGARAEDVAARANGCADALVAFTGTANGAARVDAALAPVRAEVERLRQAEERLAQEILNVQTQNVSDTHFNLRLIEQEINQMREDAFEQERRAGAAAERVEFYERAQVNPESAGDFPASVPANSEVRYAYGDWLSARRRLEKLRMSYTEEHQDVKEAVQLVSSTKQHFINVVQGARTVAEEVLASAQKRAREARSKASRLLAEREGMTLRADQANEKIARLEKEKVRTSKALEEARQKEKEIRKAAEQDEVSVRVVRPASVPTKPLYPDQTIAYAIGAAAPVFLWLLFGFLWPSAPRHHYHHQQQYQPQQQHHHHHHHHAHRQDGP